MSPVKKILTVFTLCLLISGRLYAQWTAADSVWLQEVISGKTEIRLNPEVRKAIEEDRLINRGEKISSDNQISDNQNLNSAEKIPLIIDFSPFLRFTYLDPALRPFESIYFSTGMSGMSGPINPFLSPPAVTVPDPATGSAPASHRVFFMFNLTEIIDYLSAKAKEK
ncbi:MAG: DUF4858 domain-containing protein [Tannerella sp.]|jgi:hypothetical protein|nr:DUF4858 domain-containing protein [Tannerella sp.]